MKIFFITLAFVFLAFSRVSAQNEANAEFAMLDMMYMCPYNYSGADELFAKNNVREVNIEYGGMYISMNIDSSGLRKSMLIKNVAEFSYRYYDDRRVSDADMVIIGLDNASARWIFVYGSPTADYDALFMVKGNPDAEQQTTYYCDDKGRVQRISLTVSKHEMMKCKFKYEDEKIVNILYQDVAPEGYDLVSLDVAYTYRDNGLIEKEFLTTKDGYKMTAVFSYK